MFSHGPMSGAGGGQRSCLVHILIHERYKIGAGGHSPPGSATDVHIDYLPKRIHLSAISSYVLTNSSKIVEDSLC